jgi:hypothetical protein
MPTQAEIEAVLKIKDEMSAGLNSASAAAGKLAVSLKLVVAGATAVTGAVVAATKAALDYADAIDNQMKATQASAEALQVLNVAAEQVGLGPEAITAAFRRMNDALGEGSKKTKETLESIGLSFAEIRKLAPEDQFTAISDALTRVDDVNKRVSAGTELLGRGYSQLQEVSGAALSEIEQRMRDLGVIVSEETVEKVDALGDEFGILGTAVKATFVQFGSAVASSDVLKDALGRVILAVGEINKFIIENRDAITSWIDNALKPAVKVLGEVAVAVGTLALAMMRLSEINLKLEMLGSKMGMAGARPVEEIQKDLDAARQFGDKFHGSLVKIDQILNPSKLLQGVKSFGKGLRETFGGPGGGGGGGGGGGSDLGNAISNLKEFDKILREGALFNQKMELFRAAQADAMGISPGVGGLGMAGLTIDMVNAMANSGIGGLASEMPDMFKIVSEFPQGIGDIEFSTKKAEEQQKRYNEALQMAANITQIIPGNIGQIVGQTMAAVSALSSLSNMGAAGKGGILGGIKNIFSSASAEAGGGFIGAISGIGSLVGTIGPLVNVGIQMGKAIVSGIKKLLGGRTASTVVEEAARDMGTQIPKELAEAIHQSGKNVQLFLPEIFETGGMGIDRMAEEVGDLFSFFQRGEIDKGTLLAELKETLPILIENFDQLGAAGQEQIDRIISASYAAGIELEEFDALLKTRITDETLKEMGLVGQTNFQMIREAAAKLGVEVEFLAAKVQETFAPQTLEEMAKSFDKSNDEIREIAASLGLNIQTELEKIAASVGLTATEFTSLGEAMEKAFGIDAGRLTEFLESTGLSAQELANSLGVAISTVGQIGEAAAGAAGAPPDEQAAPFIAAAPEIGNATGDAVGAKVNPELIAIRNELGELKALKAELGAIKGSLDSLPRAFRDSIQIVVASATT